MSNERVGIKIVWPLHPREEGSLWTCQIKLAQNPTCHIDRILVSNYDHRGIKDHLIRLSIPHFPDYSDSGDNCR